MSERHDATRPDPGVDESIPDGEPDGSVDAEPDVSVDAEPGVSVDAEPGVASAAEGDDGDDDAGDATTAAETVESLRVERDSLREMVQRVQADFVNFRKRTVTQSAADIDRATGRLAEALLPVLDAAEAAYVRHPDEVGPLLNAMLSELRKHGLETLDLDGEPFDPEVAEAVAHDPAGDEGAGDVVVAEVLRSGYRWKGKTLRPAMVRTKG